MESECEGGATVGGGRRVVGLGHSRSRERCKNEGNVEVASIVSGVAKRVEKGQLELGVALANDQVGNDLSTPLIGGVW